MQPFESVDWTFCFSVVLQQPVILSLCSGPTNCYMYLFLYWKVISEAKRRKLKSNLNSKLAHRKRLIDVFWLLIKVKKVWCCSNLLCCHYVVGQLIATCIYFFVLESDKRSEVKWSEVKWSEAKEIEVFWRSAKCGEVKGIKAGEVRSVYKGSEEEWGVGLGEMYVTVCCIVWFTHCLVYPVVFNTDSSNLGSACFWILTLIVLLWRIGWAHNNARK